MACGCNFWNEVSSGGAVCGGSATVSVDQREGGVVCGGSALVDILNDPYDGLEAIWPLDEAGAGVADEYQDRANHQLHGTGGGGNALYVPDTEGGVFCLPAASFDGTTREFITIPADTLAVDHGFTVSAWLRIDTMFSPRMIYSRGQDDGTANKWVFTFGYSFVNHLMAGIHTTDGTTDSISEAYSSQLMQEDKFYHVASSWDGSAVRLYINGSADGSMDTTNGQTVAQTNGGRFGSWNNGAFHTGTLQEVRLHPEAKSAAWLKAEHDNFCDSGFYVIGDEEVLGYGGLLAAGDSVVTVA